MIETQDVFVLREPEAEPVPVVVSIPHAGVEVPKKIATNFANDEIAALPMTDWHVHRLYDFLPALGIKTIHATFSRFVVDLNRGPESEPLYPGRFETGLVPTKTFSGKRIWRNDPGMMEVRQRRETYYDPYHRELNKILSTMRDEYNRAILIDAHSVVSSANSLHGMLEKHVYLGNRDGQSCDAALMGYFVNAFEGEGLTVSRNYPYKGGYTTATYGQHDRVSALQIEMCQRVYMDETDPDGAPQCEQFIEGKQKLTDIFEAFVEHQRKI